ncbi:MAG: sodium:proton antiporter [Phycisphaerales bacterium]
MDAGDAQTGFLGPRAWVASALIGGAIGAGMALVWPGTIGSAGTPVLPAALSIPFVVLLGCMAIMPLAATALWHRHYPNMSLMLGGLVVSYYLVAFGGPGRGKVVHIFEEYFAFIALVGGLYIVSGGILVEATGRGRPVVNTLLLALGAVLANVIGTTGASVVLIHPFMRLNHGRLRPIHIVFFIFIVSNCGGCLTPIGDPPLYLGYLSGVPFFWTLAHLWPMWLLAVGVLLTMFFVIDARIGKGTSHHTEPLRFRLYGTVGLIAMALMVGGVFIDPVLRARGIQTPTPVGPIFQTIVAAAAFFLSPASIRHANNFSFEPFKEVSLLFAGIFATMAPALAYLQANGANIGLVNPTQYHFATGVLSAVLDNAPTYLSVLQVALGTLGREVSPEAIQLLISGAHTITPPGGAGPPTQVDGVLLLESISLAAVFFGAMTYIGNGPNFMVKAIAESRGVTMPSFFGYLGLACVFLLPVLILNWAVFIR